jgi:hypothetical protein
MKSIVMADFGPGSDAPILLDYRFDLARPRVLRLKWGPAARNNTWVIAAETFHEFAGTLGLGTANFKDADAGQQVG